MAINPRISPYLWFDREAEGAARFHPQIFSDSRIATIRAPESPGSKRAMEAMLKAKKVDMAAPRRAHYATH